MPLSPETQALIDDCERALLNARCELSTFTSAATGTPQRISHDQYVALQFRAQRQPWTLSDSERAMLEAKGPVSGAEHSQRFAQLQGGDAWNPSPQLQQQAQQFAALADQRRAVSFAAEHKPVEKNKAYYRRCWGSSSEGRRICEAHAKTLKMELWQYRSWLWKDEPATPSSGAHPSHRAWAEKTLRQSA